jgi:predicted secreted protein
MNRKNLGLAMAALVGIFLFALTCGGALASSPYFYVKIDNKTNSTVKIKWKFTTRAGKDLNNAEAKVTAVPPHTTKKFWGSPGEGKMMVWIQTGGKTGMVKNYSLLGDTNPQALNAYYYIQYNKEGHLRIFKPNG